MIGKFEISFPNTPTAEDFALLQPFRGFQSGPFLLSASLWSLYVRFFSGSPASWLSRYPIEL